MIAAFASARRRLLPRLDGLVRIVAAFAKVITRIELVGQWVVDVIGARDGRRQHVVGELGELVRQTPTYVLDKPMEHAELNEIIDPLLDAI